MNTALRELAEKQEKLEMTPLIDVTFLLLIFFLCTLEFKTLDQKLAAHLPKDRGEQQSTEDADRLDVVIEVEQEGSRRDPHDIDRPWSREGAFQYGPDRALSYRLGPRRFSNLAGLSAQIAEHAALDSTRGVTRGVTVDARAGVVNADVMRVLDVTVGAGFTDIGFKGIGSR